MDHLIVYCALEDGVIGDVSLELLTKGRSLANQLNCKLEALLVGDDLEKHTQELFPDRKSVV